MSSIVIKKNKILLGTKDSLLLLVLFCVLTLGNASCTKTDPTEDQKEEFIKLYGGVYNNEAIDFINIGEFFYILGNTSDKSGQMNVLVIKADAHGNKVWEKVFESDKNTIANQIILSSDQQSIIIVGSQTTDDDSLYNDIKLMILNTNGDSIMFKTFYNAGNEIGISVAETLGKGYILAANSSINATTTQTRRMVFVIDEAFEIESHFVGSWSNPESVMKMISIGNSQFAMVGVSKNHSNPSFANGAPFLSIFNENGTEQVNFHFDLSGQFSDIVQFADKMFVTGVANNGNFGNQDVFVAEITPLTDEFIWIQQMGTTFNDQGNGIAVAFDQNLLVCGNTYDNLGKSDIVVYKTDLLGNKLGKSEFGGSDNEFGVKSIQIDQNVVNLGTNQLEESGMLMLLKMKLDE